MARLEKKARREGRTIVMVDEAGLYLLPGVVRTYAPRGRTPHLYAPATRDHLSVMSGITPDGRLYTLVRERALTGVESVAFLKHLVRQVGGKVLVIWDRSPIHRGREVQAFLKTNAGRLVRVESFPAYAPDLNPDEGVWQHLKHVELANMCCSDLTRLRVEFRRAVMRLRRKPELIRACFQGAGLGVEPDGNKR